MPVYTFDQLVAELARRLDLPAARPIGEIQREMLVAEALARHAADGISAGAGAGAQKALARGAGIDGVARSLAELFMEWGEAGADADALEGALTARASAAAKRAAGTCALEALTVWRRYLDALSAAGRTERGQFIMGVTKALARPTAQHGLTRIRVVGFPWLSGCEAKLVAALARSGADVEVEVRYAEPAVPEWMAEAVSPAEVRSTPLPAACAPPRLIAAAGPRREARAVAREIKKLVTRGVEASRIWVASADSEGFTPELLEALHEFAVASAAPRKRAMRNSPLVADCLKFAALIAAGPSPHRSVDIMPLVASVYLGAGPEQAAEAAQGLGIKGLKLSLAAWVRRLNRPGTMQEPGAPPAPGGECVRRLEQAVLCARNTAAASGGAGLARCAAGLREALHLLGLPASIWGRPGDEGLRVEEWQAWTALEGLLGEVANADVGAHGSAQGASGAGSDPDWDEFVSVLDFAAGRRSFPLARPASTGVAVTGINRAASATPADCDALFLCGLGEQWLPSRRRRPWMLDDGDVKAIAAAGFGSEPLGDRAAGDRHAFACAARSGVGRVWLTWSTCTADGSAARRSFLVDEHLRDLGVDEPGEPSLTTAVQAAEVFPGIDEAASTREARMAAMHFGLELAHDECFAAMRQRWSARDKVAALGAGPFGGVIGPGWAMSRRDWSERSLNTYGSCPFKFFCDYVLRVRAVDEVIDDIDSRDRGSMLHEVVRQFAAELGGSALDPARADCYSSRIIEIADAVFASGRCERSSVPDNLTGAFYSGMAQKLTRFVESEVERAVSTGGVWRPAMLEWAFGRAFGRSDAVEVAAGTGRVSVTGMVDRIDRGPGGILAVYDYKSGSAPTLTDVAKGIELQLGLYALVVEEVLGAPVAGAWYIQLPAKGRGTGVFREAHRERLGVTGKSGSMSEQEWESFMSLVREAIARCDEGEQAGQFAPSPSDRACRHCDYSCICRANYAGDGDADE